MTTNIDIGVLPRRNTDKSYILDCSSHKVKLYTTDGEIRCVKRGDKVEKQFRINIGELPVGYKISPNDQYIYVFDNALTAFDQTISSQGILIPPCIMQKPHKTVQLLIGFEEELLPLNARSNGIQDITSDSITYLAKNRIGSDEFNDEVLQDLQELLEKRCTQLKMIRGFSSMQKLIVVEEAWAEDVYKQLQTALICKKRKERDITLRDLKQR